MYVLILIFLTTGNVETIVQGTYIERYKCFEKRDEMVEPYRDKWYKLPNGIQGICMKRSDG